MAESTGTVDLDEDEQPWLVRIMGIHARLIQSGFVQDQQSVDDLNRLDDMLRAIQESKR